MKDMKSKDKNIFLLNPLVFILFPIYISLKKSLKNFLKEIPTKFKTTLSLSSAAMKLKDAYSLEEKLWPT